MSMLIQNRAPVLRAGTYNNVAVNAAAVKIFTGTGKPGRVTIQNVGGASFTTVYVGWDNAVTAANGLILSAAPSAILPGASIELEAASDIWAIGSAANGAVRFMSSIG